MFLRALIRRLTTDRVHDEFSASPKSEKATKEEVADETLPVDRIEDAYERAVYISPAIDTWI